jgi:Tol biopolymer transport system component
VRNLDGSGLRTLYSETGIYAVAVDWSEDGTSLLAIRTNAMAKGPLELILLSAADGSARVLTRMPPSSVLYQGFRISPDGRHVALSYVRKGNPAQADISVMTTDGRDEGVVAGHPADDRLRAWTPDGRGLLFASDRSGEWDLWMVPIAEGRQRGEPEVVKKSFGDAELLGVTPGGSLYYQTTTALGRLLYGAVDLGTGKVVEAPAPVATRYQMRVVEPTWSPDGQTLAYVSHPGEIGPGNNIVTIRSSTTGEERFLSPRLLLTSRISWAPDSRSIIARERKPDGTETVRIDTATSEFTRLRGDGTLPHLCPDGKTLVFLAPDAIRKQNLETGEQSEVVKVGKMSYDLSPDGQFVAYIANDAIKIVSLNGGEPRELYRGSAQSYGLEWTRDGRYIIALARNTKSSEIWRIPAQGGVALKLDLSVPNLDAFTLHPDNRRFAFTVTDGSRRELWMVENLLRPQPAAK